MTVKEAIRAIEEERKRQGLSIQELCDAAGISRASYSVWTRGNYGPTLESFLLVCAALKIDVKL